MLSPCSLLRLSFARHFSSFLQPAHRRFIKNSCSCGAPAEMNLTSLAFLYTTHARAVDGNHQFPALLSPASPFAVVGRRELAGKGCRIDFSPCWKAVS